jgi:hypothetical protein
MTDAELSLARANELLRLARYPLTMWAGVAEVVAGAPESTTRHLIESIDRHLRLDDAGGN